MSPPPATQGGLLCAPKCRRWEGERETGADRSPQAAAKHTCLKSIHATCPNPHCREPKAQNYCYLPVPHK